MGYVMPKPDPMRASGCCIQMTTHEHGNTIVTLISTNLFVIAIIMYTVACVLRYLYTGEVIIYTQTDVS